MYCRWENRHEFLRLVEAYRLNEFKLQVDAIRKGLATIVPVQLYGPLSLCSLCGCVTLRL